MPVTGLDHVNIIARDLDASARFYTDVLGLRRGDPPPPLPSAEIQWMFDAQGRALIHMTATRYRANLGRQPGGSTGGLHHVAFACADYNDIIARLEASGASYRTSDRVAGLRQIFVADPSEVMLELNFRG